jgi:hypothetical protein
MGIQQLEQRDLPSGEVLIQVAYAVMNYKDALVFRFIPTSHHITRSTSRLKNYQYPFGMEKCTFDRHHAVVIGASMAGLLAARVLSDHLHRSP